MVRNTDIKSALGQLEDTLERYLVDKAPFSIPDNWKELMVKFAPYLAIIGVVVGVFGFLALLGLGTFLVPLGTIGGMMTGRPFFGVSYILSIVFSGAIVLLGGLAIPGLFSRSKKAWTFLYWSVLVGAVQNVASFDIGGFIIGTLLSLYLLFQVKEYYK